MSAIPDLHAAEAARRVRAGEISAVEVVEAALARVAALNPTLNAIVTPNPRALDDARAVDARIARGEDPGPLAGLPVGIKDVTEVAGLRTTYGSPLYADHVPDVDALVVQRLKAAGAVILGKTNTPEFAAGGTTWNDVFGRTRNPWDVSRTPGGSTGGGCAALASGMIALAEGTDLGGSLRIPASFCGVVGLRPSVGLVPTWPTRWTWDHLQVTGLIGRTAADVGLGLSAVAGPSPLSPYAQPTAGRDFARAATDGPARKLRLAWCPDVAGIGVDAGVLAVCRDAVDALAADGHEVEEIALDLRDGREAFLALRGLWFAIHMHEHLDAIGRFGINVRNNTRAGLATTTKEIGAAERVRARIRAALLALLERFDHLVTPTMAVAPFDVEENYPRTVGGKPMKTYVDWIAPTFVLNMAALPVATVPAGLDAHGLPVGLQILGGSMGEEAVLAACAAVEALRPIGFPPLDRSA